MSQYRGYFVPSGTDALGLEREPFDPSWICSSGCFDYCRSVGYSDVDCHYFCHESNSCPDEWPNPDGPPNNPPCWIVDQKVIGVMTEEEWETWQPSEFDEQDGSEKCKCFLSPDNNQCNIERPTGTEGTVSTPGYGDGSCKIGEVVLATYKGVCQGDDPCCKDERGGCEVAALWRCRSNGKVNNWIRRTFNGKCE